MLNSLEEAHAEEKRRKLIKGYALKEYRSAKRVTQRELAEAVGVAHGRVHTWETVYGISEAVLEYLCYQVDLIAEKRRQAQDPETRAVLDRL